MSIISRTRSSNISTRTRFPAHEIADLANVSRNHFVKRFNDLRRWKAPINEAVRGVEISTEAGNPKFKDIKVEERKYDNYMYYGPVPQTEILKWDQLKQNAGWKLQTANNL